MRLSNKKRRVPKTEGGRWGIRFISKKEGLLGGNPEEGEGEEGATVSPICQHQQ